jgi:hypothetical protein
MPNDEQIEQLIEFYNNSECPEIEQEAIRKCFSNLKNHG